MRRLGYVQVVATFAVICLSYATMAIVLFAGAAKASLRPAADNWPWVAGQDTVPTIQLCVSEAGDDPANRWLKNVEIAIRRLADGVYADVAPADGWHVMRVSGQGCQKTFDSACYGERGTVYCSGSKLVRILYATAWMTAGWVVPFTWQNEDRATVGKLFNFNIEETRAIDLVDAALAGDFARLYRNRESMAQYNKLAEDEFDEIAAEALLILGTEASGGFAQHFPSSTTGFTSLEVYAAAVDYLLAYIMGHELTHAYGQCVLNGTSQVEQSGLFMELVDLQANGQVLAPNTPSAREVVSDQCALRAVELVDAVITSRSNRPSDNVVGAVVLEFPRITAIRLASAVLIMSIGGETEEAKDVSVSGEPLTATYMGYYEILRQARGHLYTALRTMLFAKEMHGFAEGELGSIVDLCGDAAKRVVLALTLGDAADSAALRDVAGADRNKILADRLGEYLPLGVTHAWRTGAEMVYDCEEGRTLSDVPPAKAAAIRRLFELTNAFETALPLLNASVNAMKSATPELPEVFWQEFIDRLASESSGFVDLLIPIYDAHLTLEQLEQLVEFYESPVGQSFLAAMPVMMEETMVAARRWSERLAAEVKEDLAQRGIKIREPQR